MINLELIEVDPTPGGNGLPDKRTVKAISSSYSALVDYCKENFNASIGKPEKYSWDNHYLIKVSSIVIVREDGSKFK